MSEKLKTIEEIIKSIKNQDFQRVTKLANTLGWDYIDPESRNPWLCIKTLMLNNFDSVDNIMLLKIINCLEQQHFYNRILGDWLVYGAFVAIIERQFNYADDFLNRATLAYDGITTTSCLSTINLAHGHIAYLRKQYKLAATFYQEASSVWRGIECPDTKLLSEINFYRLKAIIATSDSNMLKEMLILYGDIIGIPRMDDYSGDDIESSRDESFKRRFRAWIIKTFGRIGNKIDDFLFGI